MLLGAINIDMYICTYKSHRNIYIHIYLKPETQICIYIYIYVCISQQAFTSEPVSLTNASYVLNLLHIKSSGSVKTVLRP